MEQSEPLVSQSNDEMIHLTPGELNNEVKELANDVLGLVDVTESLSDQLESLADKMDKGQFPIINGNFQFVSAFQLNISRDHEYFKVGLSPLHFNID